MGEGTDVITLGAGGTRPRTEEPAAVHSGAQDDMPRPEPPNHHAELSLAQPFAGIKESGVG
ncbi:hypothetical protein ABT155_24105, partial [Streptomyces hirsutus]|uniref:hypothetical protein n=1 Tax=Streptomyces hirsutus TaxID=35620 RepID=UPI0033288DF0